MRYQVKVSPNSRQASVVQDGEKLKVRVNATPDKGKANDRLIEILSEHFKVPKSSIKILTGHTSHNKIIEVIGL